MSFASLKRTNNYLFTSESVSEGHPDKVCDQISDAILDEFLRLDPFSRVAVETLATTNKVVIAGEVRGPAEVDKQRMEAIARDVVKEIGYEQDGFHWQKMEVEVLVHEQSCEIALGVDANAKDGKDEGAGDQGIMFGYATNETPSFMPAPIHYAHLILKTLATARKTGKIHGLAPDSKSQVTLEYENGMPVRASTILVSTQHDEGLSVDEIRNIVKPYVEQVIPDGWMCKDENLLINPTGKFVIGGPDGDCGLTGRKIIVDTYGGAAPHGGGAFSGKDPTKVDRSAAYMARYLAKNIVGAKLADECTIQIAYAIGVSNPLAFYVNTNNTGKISDNELEKMLRSIVDLSPRGIREHLSLNKPIYQKSAAYGHFGRQPEEDGSFSWEKLDLMEKLKAVA